MAGLAAVEVLTAKGAAEAEGAELACPELVEVVEALVEVAVLVATAIGELVAVVVAGTIGTTGVEVGTMTCGAGTDC